MRIGVYQNRPLFGQVEANVEQAVRDLSSEKAYITVLPELFGTGYQFFSRQELEGLAEEIPGGKTCQAMMKLAQVTGMFLAFGIAERDGKFIYNSAVLLGPEGVVGTYRKTHLFFKEKRIFDPGDSGFQVFNLGDVKVGIMICFDWWFPESARTLALLGADIICHPANLVLPQCQQAMVTRALENGVFMITANRVGTESRKGNDTLAFTGESQVVDNAGNVVLKLGKDETGAFFTEIDHIQARNKKITALNERFEDRRPEMYGPLVTCP